MTSKHPLDKLEKLWNVGKLTIEQMIGQFFVYFKDYQQRFAVHERRLLQVEQAVKRLTERIDTLEAGQEMARKELVRLRTQLKGQDQA